MISILAFVLVLSATPAFGANQCRQPLEKLVINAEEIAAKYGKDCLKAIRNGATTVGEAAGKKCKAKLGKDEVDRQKAYLRKIYDTAVRICNDDCEGANHKLCKQAMRDLLILGTNGAKESLRKIQD